MRKLNEKKQAKGKGRKQCFKHTHTEPFRFVRVDNNYIIVSVCVKVIKCRYKQALIIYTNKIWSYENIYYTAQTHCVAILFYIIF